MGKELGGNKVLQQQVPFEKKLFTSQMNFVETFYTANTFTPNKNYYPATIHNFH